MEQPLKTYKCFGARGENCPINRIEQGLNQLGWMDSGDEIPSFIFANDVGAHRAAVDFHEKIGKKSKLILNILDIPEWLLPNGYNLYAEFPLIQKPDALTCISKYVQSQIHRYFGFGSYVIYNPIKDITPYMRDKDVQPSIHRVLMVGRLNDPSKRARMAIEACILAGFEEREVAIVGIEPIGYGDYLGVVSDERLNELYNSVDFVLMLSQGEGLGLPALEALAAGALPIVCHDLTTFAEFYPAQWGHYPNAVSVAYSLRKYLDNPELLKREKAFCLERSEEVIERFGKKAIAQNIVNVYNKIL